MDEPKIGRIVFGQPSNNPPLYPDGGVVMDSHATREVVAEQAAAIDRLTAENAALRANSRAGYDAFSAMRDSINEVIGDMPSTESALAHGPELAHEAAQVAEAVGLAFAALRAKLDASRQTIAALYVERDAAQADAARLREALRRARVECVAFSFRLAEAAAEPSARLATPAQEGRS